MSKRFLLLSLVFICGPNISSVGGETNVSQANEFHTFWVDFRSAVMNNRKLDVAELAYFPFETRGTMDNDPVVKHGKQWFLESFEKILNLDPGLSPDPSTMRTLIKDTPQVKSKGTVVGDYARIGDFEFEKIKGKWYFTLAYFDDE